MSTAAVKLETKTFLLALPGLLVLLVLTALIGYGLFTGDEARRAVTADLTNFESTIHSEFKQWRDDLEKTETSGAVASPYVARAMNIRLPATLRPGVLADFAIGAGDMHPTTADISPWNNPVNLFSHYQVQNPTLLAIGRFDLTFIVVALVPLLMIAVSFDIPGQDRARGTLRLVAAQSPGLTGFIWTRLVVRNLAIWLLVIGVAACAVLANAHGTPWPDRLVRFLAWAAVALLYGAFWFGLIALAVAFLKRSETVAAALIALWSALVLAVPALTDAVGDAAYPPPSRLAYLSEMREAQSEANREVDRLTRGFLLDHPELTASEEATPKFDRSAYLVNQEVDRRTGPIQAAFARSRADRRRVMALAQYLSPAVTAWEALNALAGADLERYMRFQDRARQSLRELSAFVGPAVVSGQRVSVADVDAFDAWSFPETPLTRVLSGKAFPLLYLLVAAVALIAFARRRLRASLELLL